MNKNYNEYLLEGIQFVVEGRLYRWCSDVCESRSSVAKDSPDLELIMLYLDDLQSCGRCIMQKHNVTMYTHKYIHNK